MSPGRWWIVFNPSPSAAVRLVCLPYAGGHAGIFKDWHRHLPDGVEVCGIQLPGHSTRIREQPITTLWQLVPAIATAIAPLADRPFVLFGHSLGAILAFEVTRALRRSGAIGPRHLFVSGRRAPHLPSTDPLTLDSTDEEFVARLHELKGTPPEVFANPELLHLLLPALRADFALGETYVCGEEPPLACPLSAFAGDEDEETSDERIEDWRRHTTGACQVHRLQGDHFFIHSRRSELLRLMRPVLSSLVQATRVVDRSLTSDPSQLQP